MNESVWWVRIIIDSSKKELICKHLLALNISLDYRTDGIYFSNNRFPTCYDIDDISENLNEVANQVETVLDVLKGYILLVENEFIQVGYDSLEHHYNGDITVCTIYKQTIQIKSKVESYDVIDGKEIRKEYDNVNAKRILDDMETKVILKLLTTPTYMNFYKIIEVLELKLGGEKGLANAGLISLSKLKQIKKNLNNPQLSGDKARHYHFPGDIAKNTKLSRDEIMMEINNLIKAYINRL